MSGYRYFMRSVKLNFLLIFFLILGLSYQRYADCPTFVESNTWWEAIVGGDWVKEVKVQAIKDQGVDGYFNAKIRVCAYDGQSYCYGLQSGESCPQIYGTQGTGAGVSAAAFIDWEGDKTKAGGVLNGNGQTVLLMRKKEDSLTLLKYVLAVKKGLVCQEFLHGVLEYFRVRIFSVLGRWKKSVIPATKRQ